MSTTPAPAPAIRSYFFGKGFRDLQQTIRASWWRNQESAQHHFRRCGPLFASDEWGERAQAVVFGTAGVSVMVFGTAVFLAASAVHVVILAVLLALIYTAFTVVYLAERGYLLARRFFTVCPVCHSKAPLPQYFCPGCGAVHGRLIPSSYGILRHTCRCGHRLPATFFLGRGALRSRCPECAHALEQSHTESRKLFVPVTGAKSVGKSAFLYTALQELVEHRAGELGLSHRFVETATECDFERTRDQFARGRRPDVTMDTLPRALTLQLDRPGQSPRVLYLYDPAGEAFADTQGTGLHKYQDYLSGLVFLVDPFAIPAVAGEYREQLAAHADALRPSAVPVDDTFARILIGMEEFFGLKKGGRIKVPVAVVLNKADAFGLEDRVGERAVDARMEALPADATREAVRDALIREQLKAWGEGPFVQQLETRCARVRYFTCSSLGRMPDASDRAFEGRGVLEPLLWIIGEADGALVGRRRLPLLGAA
ncbi:MAG TPA: hypothetical protein VFJ16_18790 [Longimicrobium sp.]|nr:hypothetical protein [Longimicrobium sp.]